MLSIVCASYVINVRSPQNAFIYFEAQHKIQNSKSSTANLPMLHYDLQSTNYPALLKEYRSNIHTNFQRRVRNASGEVEGEEEVEEEEEIQRH